MILYPKFFQRRMHRANEQIDGTIFYSTFSQILLIIIDGENQ